MPPLAERRPSRRKRVLLGGVIVYDDGRQWFACTIQELSETNAKISGAKIKTTSLPTLPQSVYLINIPGRLAYRAEVVWSKLTVAGLKIGEPIALDSSLPASLGYLKVIFNTRAPR